MGEVKCGRSDVGVGGRGNGGCSTVAVSMLCHFSEAEAMSSDHRDDSF